MKGLLERTVSFKLKHLLFAFSMLLSFLAGMGFEVYTAPLIKEPLSEQPYISSLVGVVNSTEPTEGSYKVTISFQFEGRTLLSTVIVDAQLQKGEVVELFKAKPAVVFPWQTPHSRFYLMRSNGEVVEVKRSG
ncbi:MAG: hypothetical protein FGF50_08670 [Candidatus Brockarchaeota archaeon]|nr:hypothetical protein [Candidatus Brockarchaeota archaeon]